MNYSYDTHLQSTIDNIIDNTSNILYCLYRMVIQPFKTFLGTQITNKQVSNAFQVGLLKKLSKSMFEENSSSKCRGRGSKNLLVSRVKTLASRTTSLIISGIYRPFSKPYICTMSNLSEGMPQ